MQSIVHGRMRINVFRTTRNECVPIKNAPKCVKCTPNQWNTYPNPKTSLLQLQIGEDGACCLRGMLSHGSSSKMFELYGLIMPIDSAYVTSNCVVDIFEVNIYM